MRPLFLSLALAGLASACVRGVPRLVECTAGVDTLMYTRNEQTGVREGMRMLPDGGIEKCDRIVEGGDLIAQ